MDGLTAWGAFAAGGVIAAGRLSGAVLPTAAVSGSAVGGVSVVVFIILLLEDTHGLLLCQCSGLLFSLFRSQRVWKCREDISVYYKENKQRIKKETSFLSG
jgi:hypothetical protein